MLAVVGSLRAGRWARAGAVLSSSHALLSWLPPSCDTMVPPGMVVHPGEATPLLQTILAFIKEKGASAPVFRLFVVVRINCTCSFKNG